MDPLDANAPVLPDEAVVADCCNKAAAGDGDALERLLAHYAPRLLSFARRKVGLDWAGKVEAEDVLQEAYTDVFATIQTFAYRGEESFYHWVTRIIDHRFVDHVRHWKRKKRDAGREVQTQAAAGSTWTSLLDRCMADPNSPSMILRREDAAGALIRCVASLPEDYRVVVQRHFLNQEPLADIAADLGRSDDAVRRLAGRALERLRECLGRASRFLSQH